MEQIDVVYEQDKQKMSKKIKAVRVTVSESSGYYLFTAYDNILKQGGNVTYLLGIKKKRLISWEWKCVNTES